MSDNTFPCLDRPGNVFRLSVYKPQGRPAYVSIVEGRVKVDNYDGRQVESFEMVMFGDDRTFRVPLNGSNTKKNRANALVLALELLEEKQLVEKGYSVNID